MGKKIIHKHFLSFIFPQEQMNFTHRRRASAQCKTSNSQWIKFYRPQIIKHKWRYPGPSELADTEGWRTILSLRSLSSRGLLSPQRSWNHSPTERWLHINFEGKTKFQSLAHVMLQRPTDDTRTGLNPQIHPFCSYPMGQFQSQSVFYHQELQPLHDTKGFPVGSDGKESASNVEDLGSIPMSGRSPGERHSNPLQHSCLENPWTEEPGRLQSMELPRVEHCWPTNTFTFRVPSSSRQTHPYNKRNESNTTSFLGSPVKMKLYEGLTVNFLPFTVPAASLLHRCWKDDSKHPFLHHGTPCWLTLQRRPTTYMMCLDFLVWYVSLWLIITLKIIIKAAGTYWNVSPVPGTWWIQSYVTLSSLQPLEECSRISILAKQKRTYCSE